MVMFEGVRSCSMLDCDGPGAKIPDNDNQRDAHAYSAPRHWGSAERKNAHPHGFSFISPPDDDQYSLPVCVTCASPSYSSYTRRTGF